jgi:hypothetical protein
LAGTLLLAAGEGVHIADGLARGQLRQLPAPFAHFISEHVAERAHELEHKERRHEDRERRRDR